MRSTSESRRTRERATSRTGLFAALALSAVFVACQSAAGPPDAVSEQLVQAELAQTFTLSPGQLARIGREGPYLGFRRVVSDSRCPMDVVCVWAGDAVVAVEIGLSETRWISGELHTDPQQPPLDAGDYRIRLTDLQPYPKASETTDAGRYRATFEVSRR